MLDARYVADHLDEVIQRLKNRSSTWESQLADLGDLASQRRQLIGTTEALAARRNAANQEMSKLAKGGDREAFALRRDELKALSAEL